ncbi:hypothetical protein KAFR_0B00110 [Kazachstania africana CBS 2517]|uniref:Enoyl reductase (ER) domain-containing protein n=1 Tax=Kazachstania africana (strain ATCC 22294 / BCRC 22015 / CBS 2517 / CECT 1963 / NBRC 1671 / NRRL Y-8276) TaxID=1071382 RepID=H2APK9_KAZAF|nr:hypothetical protein KAFR_0B00110 [Kazachstania africana CBS 2517]CCF56309.1 hypothetical protein KAFR_0B00110 [Kazachstania africana CBS 2517]
MSGGLLIHLLRPLPLNGANCPIKDDEIWIQQNWNILINLENTILFSMKAIKSLGKKAVIKSDAPLPRLEVGQVLLRTIAVSGNPVDWKNVEFQWSADHATLGCDVIGEIIKFGPDVDTSDFHIGDVISSYVHGSSLRSPENGAFAEYVAVDTKLSMHLPRKLNFSDSEHISEGPVTTYEGAASISTSWYTAGALLFHHFNLKYTTPREPQNSFPILIWGGTTAVGQALIQLIRTFNGYSKIVVTASKKNEKLLKKYGADDVFDYHDPEVIAKIKAKYTDFRHLIDCVSSKETIHQVYECSSDNGEATLLNLLMLSQDAIRPEIRKSNVKVDYTILYSAFGVDVKFSDWVIPADQSYRKSLIEFVKVINRLFLDGTLHHIPIKVYKNGLEGMIEIMDDLKYGRNSAEKLVAVMPH